MGRLCQVEGCTVDLHELGRPYFLKKKICEQHMRADVVKRNCPGVTLWRFCQQCGKLEPLSCFDGTKRNCRASLERRRSPAEKDQNPKSCKRAAADTPDITADAANTANCGDINQEAAMSDASATASVVCAAPYTAGGAAAGQGSADVMMDAVDMFAGPALSDPAALDLAWLGIQQQVQSDGLAAQQSSLTGLPDCRHRNAARDETAVHTGASFPADQTAMVGDVFRSTQAPGAHTVETCSNMEAAAEPADDVYIDIEGIMLEELQAVLTETAERRRQLQHSVEQAQPMQCLPVPLLGSTAASSDLATTMRNRIPQLQQAGPMISSAFGAADLVGPQYAAACAPPGQSAAVQRAMQYTNHPALSTSCQSLRSANTTMQPITGLPLGLSLSDMLQGLDTVRPQQHATVKMHVENRLQMLSSQINQVQAMLLRLQESFANEI